MKKGVGSLSRSGISPSEKDSRPLDRKKRMPGRERSGIHANKPSLVRERLVSPGFRNRVSLRISPQGRACAVQFLASQDQVPRSVAGVRHPRQSDSSLNNTPNPGISWRNKFEPRLWVPDFDADGCSHQHHFAFATDVEELSKALGDHQPRPVRQSHRPRARRKQPPETLHVPPFLFQAAGLHFLTDQPHAVVDSLLPVGRTPQAQTAGLLLGENHVPFGIRDRLGQFRWQRDSIAVINDPLEFAGQKQGGHEEQT